MLCGDFNMIYRAQDKNNDRLDRRSMRRFRNFLHSLLLEEIPLSGRQFSWSSERDNPTLELLDRVFASSDWFAAFPNHALKPLSSDCSDHCPLLLNLLTVQGGKRRFRFESFWTKFADFGDVVLQAWQTPIPGADPFRVLDQKLRTTARELQRWSCTKIGSIRLQLAMTREVILRLDEQQDRRPLAPWEASMRTSLKVRVLGLASIPRTIARQRARVLFLAEGDANTRFYHLQACHRRRRGRIDSLRLQGGQVVSDESLAQSVFDHYNQLLGTNYERTRRVDLHAIGLPALDLNELETVFTEDEIWGVIKGLPNEKAPGPDGFTGIFYKVAWPYIKTDVVNAFNAFWAQDFRSLHHVNDAHLILLRKKDQAEMITDFRPISLIHSFGKLITKCLANRLARVLHGLVRSNQSAFIKGRSIHDNFRNVHLTCVEIHRHHTPCVLLKVDIAKAFDSVAWNFLLETLEHMGFLAYAGATGFQEYLLHLALKCC